MESNKQEEKKEAVKEPTTMDLIIFEENKNDEGEYLDKTTVAALLILLSLNREIIKEVDSEPMCFRMGNHNCIIYHAYDVIKSIKNRNQFYTANLRYFLSMHLYNTGQYPEKSNDIKPCDFLHAVLLNFHAYKVTKKSCSLINSHIQTECISDQCTLHKNFYLNIEEKQICACGEFQKTNWDNTITQSFDTSLLFSELNIDLSKHIASYPTELFESLDIEGNTQIFKQKFMEKFIEVLRSENHEICFNDECTENSLTVQLRLINNPNVYILDLIWEDINHCLHLLLATISLSAKITLEGLYESYEYPDYYIKGILLYGRKLYKYATLDERGWRVENELLTWGELLEEIILLQLFPICVVYEGGQFQDDKKKEFIAKDSMEIKKEEMYYLEQLAVQCDWVIDKGDVVVEQEKSTAKEYRNIKNLPKMIESLNFQLEENKVQN